MSEPKPARLRARTSPRPATPRTVRDTRSPLELDRIAAAGWSPRVRRLVLWGPAALLAAALAAMIIGLLYGGGAAALAVADPGPIVMWGVPVTRLAYNLTAALTIGGLVVAVWCASRDEPEFERAMQLAQGGAAAWTVATVAAALLSYLQISNQPLSGGADFGAGLWYFLTGIESGRMWLMSIVMIAVLSTFAFATRSRWGSILTCLYSLACLWPLAALGHAAGAANHETAVGGITLHYTGASVWLGGLVVVSVVAVLSPPRRRLALIERYSQLALVAFAVTAFSGVVASLVNLGDISRVLTTEYGVLVLWKAGLLLVLGVMGALMRTRLIDRMRSRLANAESTTPPLAWLLALELAVMGVVAGVAAALGRTPSPQTDVTAAQLSDPTPAQLLSGETLPPEFEFSRLFTEWRFDPIWTALGVLAIVFYIAGVLRLHRRGDQWSVWRTIAFLLGALTLLYIVNGAPVVYGKFLFSFHMTEHMILSMIIPIFIVLGAPMTLLLRAVRARTDGSLGMREWVLLLVHSKWAGFFSHPIVAGVNFALALLLFYYTPLFRWATYDHVGHMWMIAHFLIVGYLFAESLIGIDPLPKRASYPMRLIALILVMTFHAFFGLAVMTGTGLLVAEWYGATGRTWGAATAIADQQLGGAIAWGLGEFPTVFLALIVGLQWARVDEQRARRRDRRVDAAREDAELEAYNARLRALAEREESR